MRTKRFAGMNYNENKHPESAIVKQQRQTTKNEGESELYWPSIQSRQWNQDPQKSHWGNRTTHSTCTISDVWPAQTSLSNPTSTATNQKCATLVMQTAISHPTSDPTVKNALKTQKDPEIESYVKLANQLLKHTACWSTDTKLKYFNK